MTWRKMLALHCISLFLLSAQTPTGVTQTSVVRGVVRQAGVDKPVEGANVTITCAGKTNDSQTDEDGAFRFPDLPAGPCGVRVEHAGLSRVRNLQLSGRGEEEVNFWFPVPGAVKGRVLDPEVNPAAGGQVWLLERVLQLGLVNYRVRGAAPIGADGSYHLERLDAHRSFVLLAVPKSNASAERSSADPQERPVIPAPSFYPGSRLVEGALPLRLEPGEVREAVDIRLEHVRPLCVEGQINVQTQNGPVDFRLIDRQMPAGGVAFMVGTRGKTNEEGAFRVCGVPPGEYTLIAYRTSKNAAGFFGTREILLLDQDLTNVRVSTAGTARLVATVGWSEETGQAPPAELTVRMVPVKGFAIAGLDKDLTQTCKVPCRLLWEQLRIDDYRVVVSGLTGFAYVKEAAFSGRNVLREPLPVGGAIEGEQLKITLDARGGRLLVQVLDRNGTPIPDLTVLLVNERDMWTPAIADALVEGVTDEMGTYASPALAPGRYRVAVRPESADRSPEGFNSLVHTMRSAQRVDLAAGTSLQVEVRLQ
ncbi:MAG: hypothetical protein KatS3mg082_2452 [Nitrospiraceae bacterium]|nr:MAG: hypothetical protein KatS3mg082_2452 [Nitrospiraceae bacterium]